ncbi:MAG: A/G-specific adenine glycosylase [Phycisphaeraceae bacterium]
MPPRSAVSPSPATDRVRRLRRRLLSWYDRHHRRLPWRPTPQSPPPDPYFTLVSEAMLQQTQVATVVPYFERFVAAFPTVHDLAAADEQAVLRLWQGLGYYRRARHLHAAAKMIVERFDGKVPRAVDQLMQLPGVGRYAAGAIASIAYGESAPILDGNVARVLARWFAIDEPIDETATRNRLWQLAERLVPKQRPGDFNQALMELGALVCMPKSPQCLLCPVAPICDAHQASRAAALPTRSPRRAPKSVTHHVAAIEKNGRYLFEQRGSDSLWARMWQLPTAESLNGQPLPNWIQQRFGLHTETTDPTHTFTHQTTHRTIQFTVHPLRVTAGRLKPNTATWRRLDQLDDLPLANPQRRIVAWLDDAES